VDKWLKLRQSDAFEGTLNLKQIMLRRRELGFIPEVLASNVQVAVTPKQYTVMAVSPVVSSVQQ
jgi:hypothetical protein